MRLKACSVYDKKAEAYMRPFFVPTTGMAQRTFSDEVNRKSEDNMMYSHPEDYVLYYVGEWDEERGILIPSESVDIIVSAINVHKESQNG